MAQPIYYTADMVRGMPDDGNRYECVYGELLVTPAPRPWHEVLVTRLIVELGIYLKREKVGELIGSRSDISWDRDVLVQPDVFVVVPGEARTLDWSRMKTLMLVIEVLSPSSLRYDRFTKRRRYQEAQVPLYWIVDGDQRTVEVWTPDAIFPSVEHDRVTWVPAGASAPFSLELGELFRPV